MTERKPAGLQWQTWIDRQIDEARARGEFDELPGHGRPIADLDRPRDELWWVRDKLARESATPIPPTVQLMRDHDDGLAAARRAASEAEVRAILEPLNDRIRYANSHAMSGPPCTLVTIDVEEFVARWRSEWWSAPDDASPSTADAESVGELVGSAARPRRRWWRRR